MTAEAVQSVVILLGQREKKQSITWTRLRQPADKQQGKINQEDIPQCSGLRGTGRRDGMRQRGAY